MLITPGEKKDLKKTTKRLMIFLAIVFLLDAFIAFLFFEYTSMHPVLCGFLVILITTILYIFYNLLCSKIDKRKEKSNYEKERYFTAGIESAFPIRYRYIFQRGVCFRGFSEGSGAEALADSAAGGNGLRGLSVPVLFYLCR